MTKYLVVFITSLTFLSFTTGCQPTEPEHASSPNLETFELKPAQTDANNTEPNQLIIDQLDQYQVEPNHAAIITYEPNNTDPNLHETIQTEPNQLKPTKPEPNELEPPKTEPNEAEPIKPEPNQVQLTKAEPNEADPTKAEPNRVKPQPKVTFHDKCADILKTFVDDKGMVDYKTLSRKRLKLKKLLSEFAKLKTADYNSWTKEDKIAFWINTYNLQMLKIIIDN